MELGPLFAIFTAAAFAGGQVLVRRATHQSEESFTATTITLLVGMPLFIFILPLSGEWQALRSISWQGYALLGAAGIIHFVFGRYLFFNCIRIIGANRTTSIGRTNILFSIVLGMLFLRESVSISLASGALLIMLGAILANIEKGGNILKIPTRGFVLGLSSALCAAVSSILVRPVMEETGAAYAATFISYMAASIVIAAILLSGKQRRAQLFQQSGYSLMILSAAGILILVGHLFRYSALELSPVSVVQPLVGTTVLFVFILSWIINRRIDVFNWRVFSGMTLVALGAFLVSY